ncbi:MAG: heme-binding protein [Propionibacterium sp.]|nr:heme-binding protein [Propionibacterium sp.]
MPNTVPDLDRFTHEDAWRVGVNLVERAHDQNLPISVSIRLGEQLVFHAAMPGTSADDDGWVERKSRIVQRFGRASFDVGQRFAPDGDALAFLAAFGLSPERYFPAGGAVPIVVHGTMVGVLAISGLESSEDHDLAVAALNHLSSEGIQR